jgi:hypothetical protein
MWRRLEPVHAVTYFAPECRAAFSDVGLRGFWMGCFAKRLAAPIAGSGDIPYPNPMGRPPPDGASSAERVQFAVCRLAQSGQTPR